MGLQHVLVLVFIFVGIMSQNTRAIRMEDIDLFYEDDGYIVPPVYGPGSKDKDKLKYKVNFL